MKTKIMKSLKKFWEGHRQGLTMLILLSVVLIAVESCRNYDAKQSYEAKKKHEDKVATGFFRRIEFEGHDYILYRQYHGSTMTYSGLTHDPDCECFLEKD